MSDEDIDKKLLNYLERSEGVLNRNESALKDNAFEKSATRKALEKIFTQLGEHEKKDDERHIEVRDAMSGLGARQTIAENNIQHLNDRIRELRTDSGHDWNVEAMQAALMTNRQPTHSTWYKHKSFEQALKVAALLGALGSGALLHYLSSATHTPVPTTQQAH
jgi:hypothetical protein